MKAAIVQILLVLLLCSADSSYEDDRDRMALLEFKKAISQDPHQALMSWNSSSHFCTWEGVSCRLKNPSRVTSLDLSGRGLVGPIPPSVGNLTSLEYLFLNTNELIGEIPPSLGQLRHLQSLYLANNTLQGNMPSFANCSVLKILHLGDNQIVGHIPSQVNLPPSLSELHLNDNNLTGTIPTSLADIATLDTLDLSYNYFHGTIPDEIGKFPILKFLYLGGNQLSGRLPLALLNLSSLLVLGLAFNNFTGNLPSNLGRSLFNLRKIEIAANLFEGRIPYSLINASSLNVIDLSDNYFSGVVPTSVGRLKELSLLNLQQNQFESHGKKGLEFMHSLSNCTELQILALYGNNLQGQIQYSLGNLSVQLQQLYLGSNKLSGGFPSGIRNLPNLVSLSLEDNHFTGVVPEWMGTLANLQGLYVDHNKFTGFIPSSLSNLSQLVDLSFSTNQFQGHIPADLGNLQVLHQLNFSDNNLHGTIPKEIFNIPTIAFCSLSSNNLDGALPTEIGNAKQLQYLQLSSNKLSGHIPNTLSNCESMEEVQLDQNFLDGSIPPSLGNMTSMTALNLSYNNLSGSIPKSLGSLQNLEQLDLSFNHLVGEVPEQGVFKNATAIWIKGNQGLCGGAPEQYLPRCPMTSTSSTKYMPSHLVKVLIPVVSILLVAMIIFAFLFWRKRQNVGLMLLPSFGRRFPKVSYKDLAMATKGFSASNLIGTGRYGAVYMGKLLHDDEYVVAVKVLRLDIAGAERSFVAECNALRVVRHRNLVPILTACSSIDSSGNDFKALVYKFMPQGDLHQLLHSAHYDGNSSRLNYVSLAQRLNIVVDVSDAMVYLHHDHHDGSIVHCDLKPSNILLDDDMIAHVGDFGLARLHIDPISSSYGDSTSPSSVAIHGTVGYVAPECGGGGQVSTAADVYSFGVVLLEIFIRRRPTDDMFRDGLSIAKFAEINLPDKMLQIVDPQLLQELDLREEALIAEDNGVHCLLSVLDVGLCCTKSSPSERVSMQEVSARLHGIRDGYLRGQEEN